MIKVYKTSKGIRVREGVKSVDINEGTMAIYGTLYPETYMEYKGDELVYTYYGELKVGKVYPHDAIKPELGMVVLNTRTHLVYQYKFMGTYEKAYPNAWVVAGLTAAFEDLDEDNYQILKLGDA